ncbi:unnamed protein product [Cutaneotrichosporon oleaginosum]
MDTSSAIDNATTRNPSWATTERDGLQPTIITGGVFGGIALLIAIAMGLFCYRKHRQWRRYKRERLPTVVVTCPSTTTTASAPSQRDGRSSVSSSFIVPPGFATNNPSLERLGATQLLTLGSIVSGESDA